MANQVALKKIAAALLIAGMAAGTAQAASTTGTANATVIAPVTITHDTGAALNFGTFSNEVGGTVTVAPDGTRSPGGVVIISSSLASADSFTVVSTSGYQVGIALPASIALSDVIGNTMTVSNFTAALLTAPGSVITSFTSTGSDVIRVGADIAVTAGQAAGTYTAPYTVTVNYN